MDLRVLGLHGLPTTDKYVKVNNPFRHRTLSDLQIGRRSKECGCKWTHMLSAPLRASVFVRYIKTGEGQNYKRCCSILWTEGQDVCTFFDIVSILAGCWGMVFVMKVRTHVARSGSLYIHLVIDFPNIDCSAMTTCLHSLNKNLTLSVWVDRHTSKS